MTMLLQRLYDIKETLIEEGVSPDTAEVFARLFPFFREYAYGVSIQQAAKFLDRSAKQVRRQFHELTEKGYLDRLHYRAWGIASEMKEKFDGET
jgi:predicted ArsR family transcriptional regulator